MRIRNAFGTRFSGTLGNDLVAVQWRGHEYIRAYAVSSNPNSKKQRKQRGSFADAMGAWQALSVSQKELYNRIADGMTGHNLFISRYISATLKNREPEIPRRLWWITPDGQPIPEGQLMILKEGKVVFDRSLRQAEVEIALTSSDAPYTVLLVKDMTEDRVYGACDPAFVECPPNLESKNLGIRLLATAQSVKPPSARTIRTVIGLLPPIPLPARREMIALPAGNADAPVGPATRTQNVAGA